MANDKVLISGIEYKVRKIIDNNALLYNENLVLTKRVNELEQIINELKGNLENKKNELFKFTIANTLEKKLGVEEGIDKIDCLIDEINKCIEVLSE